MNLINEKIKHKTFGVGTVVAQDESYITIEFQAKTSKFPYPSAFEKFIKMGFCKYERGQYGIFIN